MPVDNQHRLSLEAQAPGQGFLRSFPSLFKVLLRPPPEPPAEDQDHTAPSLPEALG